MRCSRRPPRQSRGLEATYAIVFFDAIRVKIRNEGMVNNRAVYRAIGVRCSGHKEILGLWIEQTEGAKFWLRVMTELRHRGTQDILIAVVDGLKGFPEAITSVFPRAVVQTCIVHLIRYSMHFAAWGRNAGRWRWRSNRSTRP
jgi:putative transposase